jgi:hypothetical protein
MRRLWSWAILVAVVLIGSFATSIVAYPGTRGEPWLEEMRSGGRVIRADIGEDIALAPTEHIRIDGVDAGTRLYRDDRFVTRTDDVFLAVSTTSRVDRRATSMLKARVESGGEVFDSMQLFLSRPDDGFQQQDVIVFELPRDRLEGAVLTIEDRSFFTRPTLKTRIDLGLSADVIAGFPDDKRIDIPGIPEQEAIG